MGQVLVSITQLALKATALGEMTQNNGHYAAQGHSRSSHSESVESPYATSYYNTKLHTISHHFRYIAHYWSNSRCQHGYLFLTHSSGPPRWTPKFTIAKFGIRKLETSFKVWLKNISISWTFRRDSRVWQTDRRTDMSCLTIRGVAKKMKRKLYSERKYPKYPSIAMQTVKSTFWSSWLDLYESVFSCRWKVTRIHYKGDIMLFYLSNICQFDQLLLRFPTKQNRRCCHTLLRLKFFRNF